VHPTTQTERKDPALAGKFVLKKGSAGKYHFNLQAGNGQVIVTSESYETKAAALNGIDSVKTSAPPPPSTTKPNPGKGSVRRGPPLDHPLV
jgi:uncharacterized protein